MSVSRQEIKWLNKDRKIFDKTQQKMVAALFYQVNVIDCYNHFMGNVDITDQLRGSYRFDHCMRKRKLWWSMFFWSFQVLLTNPYILYKKYYIIHDLKPMSQYKFCYQVTIAWIDRKAHRPRIISIRHELMPSGSSVSTTRSQTSEQTNNTRKFKGVTDISLDPTTGLLKIRLIYGMHWPSQSDKKDPIFQLHSWACSGKKIEKSV